MNQPVSSRAALHHHVGIFEPRSELFPHVAVLDGSTEPVEGVEHQAVKGFSAVGSHGQPGQRGNSSLLPVPPGCHDCHVQGKRDRSTQQLEQPVRQSHRPRAEEGGHPQGHPPYPGVLGTTVEIEQHPPGRSQQGNQALKAPTRLVQVVKDPQAGNEIEALRSERCIPQIGFDHQNCRIRT